MVVREFHQAPFQRVAVVGHLLLAQTVLIQMRVTVALEQLLLFPVLLLHTLVAVAVLVMEREEQAGLVEVVTE
jgi:hypothetical protein